MIRLSSDGSKGLTSVTQGNGVRAIRQGCRLMVAMLESRKLSFADSGGSPKLEWIV
jgi:hypothetical protein